MAGDNVAYDRGAFERREAEGRRITLQRDGQRSIGENLEEGACLSKQATRLVGFVATSDDASSA